MLMIRLQRVGRKHDPSYRVVVTQKTKGPKSGNYVELLGSYDPRKSEKPATLKADRVKYWMEMGAQPSDTMRNILINEGVIEGKKVNVLPKKTPIKKDEPKEEQKKETESKAEEETNEAESSVKEDEVSTEKEASVEEEKKDEPKEEEKEASEKEKKPVSDEPKKEKTEEDKEK